MSMTLLASAATDRRDDALHVVVIGASRGFGNVAAKQLARAGHVVFATMGDIAERNAAPRTELVRFADDEDVSLRVVELDLHDTGSVERAIAVIEKYGPIDVVVNAASPGLTPSAFAPNLLLRRIEESAAEAERVNRAVFPGMRANGKGVLVHVSHGESRLERVAEEYRDRAASEDGAVEAVVVRPSCMASEHPPSAEAFAEAIVALADSSDARPFRTYVAPLAAKVPPPMEREAVAYAASFG